MAHQSLYRRYRPQRFGEIVGQPHVVAALRNAVRDGRTGHAYLFSGPRGTGKTSTARILAKALNCTDLHDGEPCGVCEACKAVEAGVSFDLQELDAASNNGVEAMRDLIARAALGSPGRSKVYILDEVHMLSAAASNALLKTLEEPPEHVTFVLATTDPQKVLPTIRSRTQHLEFSLLGAEELERHVRWVAQDAGLSIDEEALAWVLRKGGGSARDTLSALDQVAAAGGAAGGEEPVDALVAALVERSPGAALAAVAGGVAAGREPRTMAEALIARLRDAFLCSMGAAPAQLTAEARARSAEEARALGAPALTRGLEELGEALVEMRQAPDPRIPLEVALVRLTRADLDRSVGALIERIERLERQLAGTPPAAAPAAPADRGARAGRDAETEAETETVAGPGDAAAAPEPAPSPAAAPALRPARPRPVPAAPAGGPAGPGRAREASAREGPAALARRRLAEQRRSAPGSEAAAGPGPAERAAPPEPGAALPRAAAPRREPEPRAEPRPPAPAPADAGLPALTEVEAAWDRVLAALKPRARALFRAGRLLEVAGDAVVVGLPNAVHRQHCDEQRPHAEAALAEVLGRAAPLRLVVDPSSGPPEDGGGGPGPAAEDAGRAALRAQGAPPEEDYDDIGDLDELASADDLPTHAVALVVKHFPGAVEVSPEEGLSA